jgi:hypothetical protein
MNVGIDYGLGRANIDPKTGIRYGVISQNTVGERWYEDAEADYGNPTCPKCGNEPDGRPDFEYGAECGAYVCSDCFKVWYPMELDEGLCPECEGKCERTDFDISGTEYVCHSCHYCFDSDNAYSEEPIGWNYEGDGYKLVDCLDTDIFVLESFYYTFSQFCSPCVPGAGNLDNPIPKTSDSKDWEGAARCYCLGHDWFEEGKAPYVVYRVSDDSIVNPEEEN